MLPMIEALLAANEYTIISVRQTSNLPEIRDNPLTTINETASLLIRPLWGKPVQVELMGNAQGGHGGGDTRMLNDIFEGRRTTHSVARPTTWPARCRSSPELPPTSRSPPGCRCACPGSSGSDLD